MTTWPALLLATLLSPVAGALIMPLVGLARADRRADWYRGVAVAAAAISLLLSIALFAAIPPGSDEFATFDAGSLLHTEAGPIEIRFRIGLDGLSLPFVGVTALLTLAGLLADPEPIGRRGGGYYCLVLLVEAALLGTFLARDVVLFYLFAESVTLGLFFLIGIWGKRERRAAALKFFVFGWCGGLLVLTGLLAMALWNFEITGRMTTSMAELTALAIDNPISPRAQTVVLLILATGLAVKSAMFPLHGWLPAALLEAPTGTGVILVGAVVKVGGYGVLRFGLAMLPEALEACSAWLSWFCVAGVIFGAVAALVQSDPRRILAYGCVSGAGLCMLGLLSTDRLGVQGGGLHSVNSGLALGGLLLLLGMRLQRGDSPRIEGAEADRWRGPTLATLVLLLAGANAGMPGTAGFVGIRSILSTCRGPSTTFFVAAIVGIALGACYAVKLAWLMLPWRTGSGLSDPLDERAADRGKMDYRILAAGVLAVLILWIGLRPESLTPRLHPADVAPRPNNQQQLTTNN